MSKNYSSPEFEIRKYNMAHSVFTDSDPGLHDGDEFEIDAFLDEPAESVFGE